MKRFLNFSQSFIPEAMPTAASPSLSTTAPPTGESSSPVVSTPVDHRQLAESLGVPYLEEMPPTIDKMVLSLIPEETAKKYKIAVFEKKEGILSVAMVNPQDFEALNVLRFIAEKERLGIEVFLVSDALFTQMIKRYTGTERTRQEAIQSRKKE